MLGSISEAGIYAVTATGELFNYGKRWGGFGYMVPIRELSPAELDNPGNIFAVLYEEGHAMYYLVRQRDTWQDAVKYAGDMDTLVVYSLKDRKWVNV